MDRLLTWEDISAIISKMTTEQRRTPALGRNSETGEFFGYTGIEEVEEDGGGPSGHFRLLECDDPF